MNAPMERGSAFLAFLGSDKGWIEELDDIGGLWHFPPLVLFLICAVCLCVFPLHSSHAVMADASATSTGVSATASTRMLLVTADDLGYAPERDAGIIYGFEHGAISQASVRHKQTRNPG